MLLWRGSPGNELSSRSGRGRARAWHLRRLVLSLVAAAARAEEARARELRELELLLRRPSPNQEHPMKKLRSAKNSLGKTNGQYCRIT